MGKVNLAIKNHIATLTINNPPVNALSREVTSELFDYLNSIKNDHNIRVVMLKGAGNKAFMAGADIKELPPLMERKEAVSEFVQQAHRMVHTLATMSKPTIAIINGLALGGGYELALACDLRIASKNSQLGLPEIKLGILPGGGGTQRLSRLVGTSKAKELMFLGDSISAEEAYRIGLVNFIVPDSEVMEKAEIIAKRLTESSSITLGFIKRAVDQGIETTLEEGLRLEIALFERVFSTTDAYEGVRAFIEKRTPLFNLDKIHSKDF